MEAKMDVVATIVTSLGIPVRLRTVIAIGFALIVGLVCVLSFGGLFYLKLARPAEDVGLFLNIFLSSLGYIVGILTGILGIKSD
jgi:hypothetical protein